MDESGKGKNYTIYQLIYEDPLISCVTLAEKTGIPKRKVQEYLTEMYEKSILKGPLLSVKPAQNYHEYAYFLNVDNPLDVYKGLKGIYGKISCGSWNLLVITDRKMDISSLPGFKECIFEGRKSATHASKVMVQDFEESIKRIEAYKKGEEAHELEKTLYEEISLNTWDTEEWILYRTFRNNIRVDTTQKLKECSISLTKYKTWISSLDQFALIQPAFYPEGLENYYLVDFLFESLYHQQIKDILGLLPSTSLFFSVNDSIFVRLFLLNKKEESSVLALLDEMNYMSYSAYPVFSW
ncbi:MAG: hypothetical protein HXS54_18080 [Theionarchaea archaeon]|nr:hypothetical protein [Theionarchaea archaeon]